MKLSWQSALKNIIPILSAIIGVAGIIFVHTYFKPELWYEEGSYYRSGERAITSLRVQNYGHEDAEEIRISVSFPDTILDITTGEDAIPFTIGRGGIGSKAAWGTIGRLVPNESVYIYFAVKNPDGVIPASYNNFVVPRGIVYKSGMANEGKPSNWLFVAVSWSITLLSLISSWYVFGMTVRQRLQINAEAKRITELQEQTERMKSLQQTRES
jgi:hypothetical protein